MNGSADQLSELRCGKLFTSKLELELELELAKASEAAPPATDGSNNSWQVQYTTRTPPATLTTPCFYATLTTWRDASDATTQRSSLLPLPLPLPQLLPQLPVTATFTLLILLLLLLLLFLLLFTAKS
ncbi:hypothetical protein ACLKA6_008271 [Drosophila palustris]